MATPVQYAVSKMINGSFQVGAGSSFSQKLWNDAMRVSSEQGLENDPTGHEPFALVEFDGVQHRVQKTYPGNITVKQVQKPKSGKNAWIGSPEQVEGERLFQEHMARMAALKAAQVREE